MLHQRTGDNLIVIANKLPIISPRRPHVRKCYPGPVECRRGCKSLSGQFWPGVRPTQRPGSKPTVGARASRRAALRWPFDPAAATRTPGFIRPHRSAEWRGGEWPREFEAEEAKPVWSDRTPWKEICWRFDIGRATADRRCQHGLCLIVWRLNGRRLPEKRPRSSVVERSNKGELSK